MLNNTYPVAVRMARFALVLAAAVFAGNAVAADDDAAKLKALVERVSARMPALAGAEPVRTPVPGIIELRSESGIVYATEDGRYLFGGPLFDVRARKNLTAGVQNEKRAELVAGMAESAMIVFEPKGEVKYTLTTFTDIDCGYCRKLHKEMSALNDLGIRVRYMMFPRAGLGSDAHRKAVAVWCADDRLEAMTNAKAGKDPGSATCSNPVESHMTLAKKLGLRGTPFSVTESGEAINGYLPPQRMAKRLAAAAQ